MLAEPAARSMTACSVSWDAKPAICQKAPPSQDEQRTEYLGLTTGNSSKSSSINGTPFTTISCVV